MKKIIIITLATALLLMLWLLAEENDYLKAAYNDLTLTEESTFTKEANPTLTYVSYFGDNTFTFPRQDIDKIKLFENKPILGTLTSRTLKQKFNPDIIKFFNASTNFHWGETTWEKSESQYILRFYHRDKVVGKIYVDLETKMVNTRPFTPNVKFGGLTDEGRGELKKIMEDKQKWN
jgi:hypothetical protein